MFRRRAARPASDTLTAAPSSLVESNGARGRGAARTATVLPTVALLQQILDEYGLIHGIDDDGDLVVRWDKYSVYFFFYGEHDEVLQARAYLNRRVPVESRSPLIVVLDDWNRTKLGPKVYTVLPDDGMVGICAEQCHDFDAGAIRAQVKYTVGAWIDGLMRFVEWIDDQV